MRRALSLSTESSTDSSALGPANLPSNLVKSRGHHLHRPAKLFRHVRAAFRAFPILTATPALCRRRHLYCRATNYISGSTRLSGTLYGHRKARITLAIQDNPRSVPLLLLELAVPTTKFMTNMGSSGLIRVALECEKQVDMGVKCKTSLLEEPMWTAFVNGKNVGYGTRRDVTERDLKVMRMLHMVSMGAGVLPESMTDPTDGELMYMRAHFERVVGNKDSETFYMLNPEAINTGPELSIFFVRI